MKRLTLTTLLTICFIFCFADQRKINFCRDWQLHYPASAHKYAGTTKMVTLPRAWNEDFAYKVGIAQLPDDTCRYVKTFTAPMQWKGKKVFIEFEGVRQCAEVWLNGHRLGMHENGVMAFGFDLTPYIIPGKENRIDVLTDNDWVYKEKATGSSYQWNNKNFNMNMERLRQERMAPCQG